MDCLITDYKAEIPENARRAVLEDSIMHAGYPVTAGSKMLESFISPITATVVERLESAGIKIIGKAKMNEFAIAPVREDDEAVPGAISAVRGGISDFALCNDYSGCTRYHAAQNELCYIHPTYGTVSRFGLIPAAPSMDQIGIVCKDISAGFECLSIIAGNDRGDGAMYPEDSYEFAPENKCVKIGIPVNAYKNTGNADKSALEVIARAAVGEKISTTEFELPYFDVYAQVMYILSCAEISNNLSRYDGVKFGHRTSSFRDLDELYIGTRTEGFGSDAKLTAIMGAMVLSQENYTRYYDKAMRIRRLIRQSLDFGQYDVIAMPVGNGTPYERGAFFALPQLAGLPSVTIRLGDGAVSLIADSKKENALLTALKAVEL